MCTIDKFAMTFFMSEHPAIAQVANTIDKIPIEEITSICSIGNEQKIR